MDERIKIIKKDGSRQDWNSDKIRAAVNKSSVRAICKEFSEAELNEIITFVEHRVEISGQMEFPIAIIHNYVEAALELVSPPVAKSYRNYRDYKKDFAKMMDDINTKANSIMYRGDKENANADSALVSTKRSLIFNQLNKELYQKFFLTDAEIVAVRDGYVYIHDMSARRDTMNCCLFDMPKVLNGGFEMANMWYNEPNTLQTAGEVIGDVVLSAASQQYGGFTIPEVDKILDKYAEKSYQRYFEQAIADAEEWGISEAHVYADAMATRRVTKEMAQVFQGWEYKFNTVSSSRGDYPFTTISLGLATTKWGKLAAVTALKVRAGGQGKKENKKPVLFPKIVFLYDEKLHGPGGVLEEVFEAGIECSSKAMYPDWLSMSGEGYISSMYKKYGKPISPMGCRAFLSPWWKDGGMYKGHEEDEPIFIGRFNIGAVSLNLPMILAKAREESRDFYEVLEYYLQLIRGLHIRTYAYLGEMKASTNPLAYCEGGFLGGHLQANEKIAPLLKSATASFGITAFNELQQLYNGKSLKEDGNFALDTLRYINERINVYKEEDGNLYAIYGTPAENLCGTQVMQFRKKYGIVPNVSDKEYVSNSFHLHVSEDVTPTEKQDLEYRFWELSNGGKIQYVKYPVDYNTNAIKALIRRAMDMGLYEGVNMALSYCDDCGHQELNMDTCPVCGSKNLTKIDRMNGYLAYSRVKGGSRLSDHKMAELADRKSM